MHVMSDIHAYVLCAAACVPVLTYLSVRRLWHKPASASFWGASNSSFAVWHDCTLWAAGEQHGIHRDMCASTAFLILIFMNASLLCSPRPQRRLLEGPPPVVCSAPLLLRCYVCSALACHPALACIPEAVTYLPLLLPPLIVAGVRHDSSSQPLWPDPGDTRLWS
jgi:hypothetical protein